MKHFLLLLLATPAFALEPAEIIIVVNKNMPASKDLASHYAKARGVPAENIVLLDLPQDEDISRQQYDRKLVEPLREALKDRKDKIKCLLCMYGVPLRVGGATPSEADQSEIKKIDPQLKEANDAVKAAEAENKKLEGQSGVFNTARYFRREVQKELDSLRRKRDSLNRRRNMFAYAESHAAVDSELMLLWWDRYELRRWQTNLNNWQVQERAREKKEIMLLTCRLDGPSPEVVKRMIDDAVSVEKEGLKGKVYVDARGIRFDPKGQDTGHGYGGYDESMREMASILKGAQLDVVLDDKESLFGVGSCPDAALYCGWYSHANFIDCCKFAKGAVAWHLASSEAVSLRRADAKYWCKNLLEKGACATLGPVAEPYTIGFPKPAEFFGLLATGKYTLAECYGKTVYFASWMGTLVGDPLYNPYKMTPMVKEVDLKPSPKGGRSIFGQ
jgi:uncharacterized protein (TIGR03790 family)